MSKTHTHSGYEQELKQVRDNLLRMAGCVEDMISNSIRSLVEGDIDLARITIENDHKVNRFEVDTDELCLLILAKRQPMASDLRFITLAMKMVTDIERIGDLAVNIAERTIALDSLPHAGISPLIQQMADAAQVMVRRAIDAFVHADDSEAEVVFAADDEVDQLYYQLCRTIEGRMHDDNSLIERGTHIRSVAKFLERIGDHATNLAEMVIFLVQGKDVRHQNGP